MDELYEFARAAQLSVVVRTLRDALRSEGRDMVVTHHQRLLDYIVPDRVHVMAAGRIVRSGDCVQAGDPVQSLGKSLTRQHLTGIINDLDVVVVLGPVISYEQHHASSPTLAVLRWS